jgi:signal transduction histidine kinase
VINREPLNYELQRFERRAPHPIFRAARGETVRGLTVRFIRPTDQRRVWASVSAAPMSSVDGRMLGVVATISDTTTLNGLLQSEENLLYIVSHDLRNPLTVISAQAELLDRKLMNTQEYGNAKASISAIAQSVQRLNAMIQDLADAVRSAGGQLVLRLQPLDISSFLKGLLIRLKDSFPTERIVMDIPEQLRPVQADHERLERIFMNLFTNALKFSPTDSMVQVKVRSTNRELEISIIDHGEGITTSDLPHVFERSTVVKGVIKLKALALVYILRNNLWKLIMAVSG